MGDAATIVPRDVDHMTAVLGAGSVRELLPPYASIPDAFKGAPGNAWVDFVSGWFFNGANHDVLRPRAGIDRNRALRHCGAVMRSFEPKHEHKIAGVAYLLSLWFEELAAPAAAAANAAIDAVAKKEGR